MTKSKELDSSGKIIVEGQLNLSFFGDKTELLFSIVSGFLWMLGMLLSFIIKSNYTFNIVTSFFIAASLFGGFFTSIEVKKDLMKGKFQIDFLMLFAAIGAAVLGKWSEAALLLFLFSLGHSLEHYALKKARSSILALSDLTPLTALLKKNNELVEVLIDQLKLGDIIVVKPNSKITADGVVVNGESSVNQAPITGESIPVNKVSSSDWENEVDIERLLARHRVFAGTINGNGVLEIKVLKRAKDSTLSRLIELVEEAETQKSPTQHITDKFEKYYVPIVLILVLVLMFTFLVLNETFEESFYRAMSVLIAASPCALAISTHSAILAGIARAANQGVLIKGGRPLEDLGNVSIVAFDKTGTLTQGHPTLTHVIPFKQNTQLDLLKVAVAVESLSNHPLSRAIVNGGKERLGDIDLPKAYNLKALTAKGVRANCDESIIHIGNRRLFEDLTKTKVPVEINSQMVKLESKGHTVMIIHKDQEYLGLIAVMDTARKEATITLNKLREIGVSKIVMLTGDNQRVANAIAGEIGITAPLGNLMPEDKVNAIIKLKNDGTVAMVGDGVNDAPAMAKSSVGIAMGAAGSDVALETADVALMANKLDKLPFAIGLSRKASQIIKQNLILSLGMVLLLVPFTIFGILPIGLTVVGHEGSTVLVVLNALRLLRYDKD